MKRTFNFFLLFLFLLTVASNTSYAQFFPKTADKPLFRDHIYDGAADPVVIWNHQEKKWFMFYTNRRANIATSNGVDWVHGTPIGIAESVDGGATWKYRNNAVINYGNSDYSFWAPDVVEFKGLYHMFLTVVPGTFSDWQHPRSIIHLTSKDLIHWEYESALSLASDKVIDAGLIQNNDGWWYLFYNNERDAKSIYYARSRDLYSWENIGKVVGDRPGEGPAVFFWQNKYFMIVDNWRGLGVYWSDDLHKWHRQPQNLLTEPGKGADDGVIGQHAGVVISGKKAYLFYFTHPGRVPGSNPNNSYETRRSSIQVTELKYVDGELTCDRDLPVKIKLKRPKKR